MFSIHTLTLRQKINISFYREIEKRIFSDAKKNVYRAYRLPDGKLVCEKFKDHGMILKLWKNDKGSRLDLQINPQRLFNRENFVGIFDPDMTDAVFERLQEMLDLLDFGNIDDFYIARIDFCRNLEIESRAMLKDYLRLIGRSHAPYGYKKEFHRNNMGKRDNSGMYVTGKEATLYIYDKFAQMENENLKSASSCLEYPLLRFEFRMKRRKVRKIMEHQNLYDTRSLLENIACVSEGVFRDYIPRFFQSGEYHTLPDARKIIKGSSFSSKVKNKMLVLLEKSADYQGLDRGIEEMKNEYGLTKREVRDLLARFDAIALNPLPLPQRCHCRQSYLPSIPHLLGI